MLDSILAERDELASELAAVKELLFGAENLGDLTDLIEPDYQAKWAELRAQVRYLADEIEDWPVQTPRAVAVRLRALVGPWPHERKPERLTREEALEQLEPDDYPFRGNP